MPVICSWIWGVGYNSSTHLKDHLFSAAVVDHSTPEGLVTDVPVVDAFISPFTAFLCKLMCRIVFSASWSFSIPVNTWSVFSNVEARYGEWVESGWDVLSDSQLNLSSSGVHIRSIWLLLNHPKYRFHRVVINGHTTFEVSTRGQTPTNLNASAMKTKVRRFVPMLLASFCPPLASGVALSTTHFYLKFGFMPYRHWINTCHVWV